ncbi:MAG: protein-L-isoaspartate(D-aspartate) O-methyltransferase [Candidatus Micrarchaeota archaeon]|nr:protein-L-isoaspartate(D-aspartate) O-methyltransferase [Candidatus Micrarchaeota archaeon]
MDGKGAERERMFRFLRETSFLKSERVEKAMRRVDRELFVPESEKSFAYYDCAIPIGHGQTISAPAVVAFMLEALDLREGMRVLEVGAGSGYNCALLSVLVGQKGKVVSVERVPELAELAKANIASAGISIDNIEIMVGDGSEGYGPEAPYDRVIVTAALPSLDLNHPLIAQLKKDGKLLAPVGSYVQDLVLFEKRGGSMNRILPVMFVPLVGKYGFAEK